MAESAWQKKQRLAEEREQRIIAWTEKGVTEGDTEQYEGLLYWGFWVGVGGEEVPPPIALFDTEEKAEAFAALFNPGNSEIHVGPVLVESMLARDNFEVPK